MWMILGKNQENQGWKTHDSGLTHSTLKNQFRESQYDYGDPYIFF